MAIRESIHNKTINGIGGFLSFDWLSTSGLIGQELTQRLHVEDWEIEHLIHDVELPMSGGRGSISRRRVCDDFNFVALVPLDLTLESRRSPSDTDSNQPFYDGRMKGSPEGFYHISMRFQCGDPSFSNEAASQTIAQVTDRSGTFYICERVSLRSVRTINSARGDNVVMCIVRGSGSAPLRRFQNGVYVGAGALSLSEQELSD